MNRISDFLLRHRRLLLISLLTVTLLISSAANRRRLEEEAVVTSLPVVQTKSAAITSYIDDRNASHMHDTATLKALVEQEDLEDRVRKDAAVLLQEMIRNRETEEALEEALAQTPLAPCTAIVTGSSVTIVTDKQDISREDSVLVLTLAAAHAGSAPEDVRIITAE